VCEIGHDRTAQVRALLVVREVLLPARPHHDAGVVRLGVAEDKRAADGNRLRTRDAHHRQLPFAFAAEVLEDDPQLPDRKREAGQDQELREVAASHELVLRPVDRKIVPPLRLVMVRAAVGRDGQLVWRRSRRLCRCCRHWLFELKIEN
jgi:hypothetical protein